MINMKFNCRNEEWNQFITTAQERILKMTIPVGIDPPIAKNLLSQLDDFYAQLRIIYGDLNKKINELDKLIYVIEHKYRVGKNDIDRRISGIKQAESYEMIINGVKTTVNLYKEQILFFGRLKEVESIIDIINKKTANIITLSGLMKIEASLTP